MGPSLISNTDLPYEFEEVCTELTFWYSYLIISKDNQNFKMSVNFSEQQDTTKLKGKKEYRSLITLARMPPGPKFSKANITKKLQTQKRKCLLSRLSR